MQAATRSATTDKAAATSRIQSIDLLRGVVMVIMAIDHVREFFHAGAYQFSPEDLTRTSGLLFFTRWITHFCAPVFVFLSGASVRLASAKRQGPAAVSRHLIARGLWLILLEWTVLQFMWVFDFQYQTVVLQIIWVIGWSMIVLAALIWLPQRVMTVFALAMIALHNLLDGIAAERFGNFALVWNILHTPTTTRMGHTSILVSYPLVPWIGVMAAGYCFAEILKMDETRRRRILLHLGIVLTVSFFVMRLVNMYGDPQPWAPQKSAVLTVMSFFRTSKYPPSLEFLLMTLGPAILTLGLIDRLRVSENNPLRVFGRVPMFYYICHFYLIHATALVFSGLRYGRWVFSWNDPDFPKDWGYNLAITYVIWLCTVVSLYFPCRWYMHVKQRIRSPWLSFL
jgi:uncharacterized membrane protein